MDSSSDQAMPMPFGWNRSLPRRWSQQSEGEPRGANHEGENRDREQEPHGSPLPGLRKQPATGPREERERVDQRRQDRRRKQRLEGRPPPPAVSASRTRIGHFAPGKIAQPCTLQAP